MCYLVHKVLGGDSGPESGSGVFGDIDRASERDSYFDIL